MMRTKTTVALLRGILALALAPAAIAQESPPAAPAATQPADQKPAEPEKPKLYDENADAKADIAAALAKAKRNNKRVIIQWGANWCGWCYALDNAFKTDRQFSRKLLYEYELVHVDIGRGNKNNDIAKKYEADYKSNGLPYLTVLDADGTVVADQETGALEDTESETKYNTERVMAFFEANQAPTLNADEVLSDAMQRAQREDKRIFLHFGAPWCGWCHRLEDWMALMEINKILAEDFIPLKVDIDRMTNGKEVLGRYTGGKSTGIPFSVILDPDGAVVSALVDENGSNLGCPWTDKELEGFRAVLDKVCRNIDQKQRDELVASIRAEREKRESGSGH